MMTKIVYILLTVFVVVACGKKEVKVKKKENLLPQVSPDGISIHFPNEKSIAFFDTDTIGRREINASITAPAKVSATILSSKGDNQRLILFENQDLAKSYTDYVQHRININRILNVNIKQKKIELDRAKDLFQHGAATGKDLLEAQTALAIEETNLRNEEAANIENETNLIGGGFQPNSLFDARTGTSYIVVDIPESQLNNIRTGNTCNITFPSFPNQTFHGKIDAVNDLVDQVTRMIKLRVTMENPGGMLKAGMFATVFFKVGEGSTISVDKNCLVTVQGKDYVFLKTDSLTFVRREVSTGDQIGERVVVYNGLKNDDIVAAKGAMQLKGLSFGY